MGLRSQLKIEKKAKHAAIMKYADLRRQNKDLRREIKQLRKTISLLNANYDRYALMDLDNE